ncbi:MAG TPA: hypothetical protein VFU78_18135 [Thermomicrobiales bacterium]|nr:hypothetical protein [Thermomicrobiales bacterium]
MREDAPGRVTASCQASDISFVWQLAEAGAGSIRVSVRLPESEAHRQDGQQRDIGESLVRLAALAEATSDSPSVSR